MSRDLAAPPVSPVVWEAALGRRVVLIEDRLWVSAREKARAMLGGEPDLVREHRMYVPPHQLRFFDKPAAWYWSVDSEGIAIRVPRGIV